MPNNKNLTPQEQQNLNEQLRIASREAEIRENMVSFPGPSSEQDEAHDDAFVKNIMDFEQKWDTQLPTSVGTMLGDHTFLDAEKLIEAAAESAVIDLLNALAKKNVRIDCPEMVSAKDFYRWLCEDFVKKEVSMPLGEGWNANYIYIELVPEGPDAMNFMVKTCVDGLFNLDYNFHPWIFEDKLITREEGDYPTQVVPELNNYISAWRHAIGVVDRYRYTPLKGTRISEKLADFEFDVNYAVIRENHDLDTFNGTGNARLVYDGHLWSIRHINFPGFEMPKLFLS